MKDDRSVEEQSPARVVVIGGGVGGTRVANLLAHRLRGRAAVDLVTASPMHVYEPGLLYVPFDDLRQVETARAEADLTREEIVLYGEDPAKAVDAKRKRVTLAGGRELPYDYLVLATGAEPDADRLPGLAGAAHGFRTLGAARKLRAALGTFEGGRIVVGLPALPHKNPVAPFEFAFLLADFLERWGLEDEAEIVVTHPAGRLFPDALIADRLGWWLEERGIKLMTEFTPERVEGKRLQGAGGRAVEFDLLVMDPPERGVAAVRASGLADASGWLPADPHSLRVAGARDVWAVGDCTALEVGKWPSAGTHQAEVVAEAVLAEFTGQPARRRYAVYDGQAELFMEVGRGRVALVEFDYHSGYTLHEPNPALAAGKFAFDRGYWQLGPTGLL